MSLLHFKLNQIKSELECNTSKIMILMTNRWQKLKYHQRTGKEALLLIGNRL